MKRALNWLSSFYSLDSLWSLIVAAGAILRLRQYLVNRSLWVDEAMLALNIVNRTSSELTKPLDYNQGAPIGFLLIEKFIILVFGNHDYILRLFPLISGILSVYLMYRIAKEYLGKFGMFAVLLVSISTTLIYYSSELKQYASDVMIILLLTYLSSLCFKQKASERDFILLGIAGMLSIWVSHPSAFMLTGIGMILVVEKIRNKADARIPLIIGICIIWSLTFLATYLTSLRYLIANQNLRNYWQSGFMPLPPWEHWNWYKIVFVSLLPGISPYQTYLVGSCFVLILMGIISLFLRNRKIALLILSPFLLASVASILQRYPLNGRFIHFLIPFTALLMAEGLSHMYSICASWNRRAAILVYGSVAVIILWASITTTFHNALLPPRGEDIKPVLAYIQTHIQKNDIVYIHKGSVAPFLYYASSYGLNADNTIIADVNTKGIKGFLIDMENLKGENRIWFVFSHVISCGGCKGDRVQYHVQLLDQNGVQQDRFEASKAAVYLYNLNP